MNNFNALTDEETFNKFKKEVIQQIEAFEWSRNDDSHFVVMVCPKHPIPGDPDFLVATAGCAGFFYDCAEYMVDVAERTAMQNGNIEDIDETRMN